jgi:phosphoglycerol transferase MdoB-like AlkP superfamily enzyme
MRALSLLIVFVLAKLAILGGHSIPVSVWTPLAYFWQDALIALLFAALEWRLPARVTWSLYWTLSIFAAFNIPIVRAVSTPLTLAMLRAARGPLSDSFLVYITWQNAALVALTLAAAALFPRVLRRVPTRAFVTATLPIVVLGPIASARVETLGLHRNAVVAIIRSALPEISASASTEDWRTSHISASPSDDLSMLRGIAKGRNVVMVSLESTAAQYLSFYGGEGELTPHLTALARNAVVFENAYAVYPESIKGLFSVLCSTYPAFDSPPESYVNVPCPALPAQFAASGYHTSLFHSGRFNYLGMKAVIENRGYRTLEDAGDIGGNHNSSFGVDEPSTVARMLAWIDGLPRSERFFLTYLPIAGHHPYETPERGPFPDREEIGRYRNSLLYGDASLGTLIAGLRARGLDDNTLWIIYGDHGEAFGQHEGNYGHTFFLYDENVRVPFVIAAPGLTRGRRRVKRVVSLADTAPTILDLSGVAVPAVYQGHSMLDPSPRMALFFADYSLGMLGVRDGPWKVIYEIGSGRARMFNLESDPHEEADVSRSNPERSAWYTRIAQSWSGAQKSYLAQWTR